MNKIVIVYGSISTNAINIILKLKFTARTPDNDHFVVETCIDYDKYW